ncbi:MAG: diacylglycerol kinase [Anaerolineales bacterium]|nr:MAG: diacylglycerol kinase [Anaerolineales bacterium]
MVEKTLIIVNPIAGQGYGRQVLPEIENLVKENAPQSEIAMTEYVGHAILLARQAASDGHGIVIAAGGDGTSNEVLNGLMEAWDNGYRNTKMGIIAIGRGNDFAFGFGVPPGLPEGFKVFMKGDHKPMDVGLVKGGDYPQGRYFGNGVGIGFDAVVGFEAMKLTHLHGFMNYMVAALRTIFLFFNAPLVRIEYDDAVITQPSLMISIMNGRRMGGGFMMAPQANTSDGLLDLCIAGQLSRIGILTMIPRFMKGTQATQPQIKTGRAAKIHVKAEKGTLPTHADGETICTAGSELEIKIIHCPLEIIAPAM